MVVHARDRAVMSNIVCAVEDAAAEHDLGKLDEDNQRALRADGRKKLPWDHVDAGVASLLRAGADTAAWLVRAHHAPGLPDAVQHFAAKFRNADQVRRLRGRRNDDEALERHQEQIRRTDAALDSLLRMHASEIGVTVARSGPALHGLPLRLALSCLVDADHTDTASYEYGHSNLSTPPPRWEERLAALDRYVDALAGRGGKREADRLAFYRACRDREPDLPMAACEGPVGIGKTTAVSAYLLRRAIATNARRLIVVAPFTTILSQTARRLREALVLPDEAADTIVAEHHHRAEFQHVTSRDLAVLWRAPVVLTTAVQFFETLASNLPAALRKLHALPGSVIFIDEAHAAIPAKLWPQNWQWMKTLVEEWGCSVVFASGSQVRFWENADIVGEAEHRRLPELASTSLAAGLKTAEVTRVIFKSLGRLDGAGAIASAVRSGAGPRLLILNTVHSAAVLASKMRQAGDDVMHISTALTPEDRTALLSRITARLEDKKDNDWTLVATSLIQAGVELSFASAFRERFSASSMIQVGGRVNRHGEFKSTAIVYDFFFDSDGELTHHPGATRSARVLRDLFKAGRFNEAFDPAELVTEAMRLEISDDARGPELDALCRAERARQYPEVASLGRVIDSETQLVLIDPVLRQRLERHEPVTSRELLGGSVQIRFNKLATLGLQEIGGRRELFWWPYRYDKDFLGYMDYFLSLEQPGTFII